MSLAVSNYMRQFYKGNSFGATVNGRSGQPSRDLFSADMKAIRRAVKELGDYDYEDGEGGELMNKVQAFVSTYNNYIDSAKGMDDSNVNRYLSKMKKLTKEHADELADIGITIQSSGKLKVDKKALQDTGRYQVSLLFSEDAEYGKMTDKQMKQTYRMYLRNNLNASKQSSQTSKQSPQDNGQQQNMIPPAAASGAAAGISIQSAQQTMNNFVGSNIDYLL